MKTKFFSTMTAILLVFSLFVGNSFAAVGEPNGNSEAHNITVNDYNFQIKRLGYSLYTDKLVTGSSTMYITISDWTLLQEYYPATKNKLTISCYDSNGNFQISNTVNPYNVGYVRFYNLKANKKYYFAFTVPTNGNKYSFHGSISAKKPY